MLLHATQDAERRHGAAVSSTEYFVDDIYAFFTNCFHLKDWLINDPAYTKHTRQQVEDHISNTPGLAICADICNGLKHLERDKEATIRSGHQPTVGNKEVVVDISQRLFHEDPPTRTSMRLTVEHDGKNLDAFQLATDAWTSWQSFIQSTDANASSGNQSDEILDSRSDCARVSVQNPGSETRGLVVNGAICR